MDIFKLPLPQSASRGLAHDKTFHSQILSRSFIMGEWHTSCARVPL